LIAVVLVLFYKFEEPFPRVAGEEVEGMDEKVSDVSIRQRFAGLQITLRADESRKTDIFPRFSRGERTKLL
jgi:hypothetical protein